MSKVTYVGFIFNSCMYMWIPRILNVPCSCSSNNLTKQAGAELGQTQKRFGNLGLQLGEAFESKKQRNLGISPKWRCPPP